MMNIASFVVLGIVAALLIMAIKSFGKRVRTDAMGIVEFVSIRAIRRIVNCEK